MVLYGADVQGSPVWVKVWEEYSRRKKALPSHLTNEEYEAEIRRICEEIDI